jgi:hypothetical protein
LESILDLEQIFNQWMQETLYSKPKISNKGGTERDQVQQQA